MKKILLSYTTGAILLLIGLVSLTQSVNPNFLAQADTVEVSRISSSVTVAIIGGIFFIIGFLLIVVKVMKGHK